MKILKGFVNVQSLLSNVPGVVSPVGELSSWGLTYSREIGEYSRDDLPGYRLLTMYSGSTNSGLFVADNNMAETALLLAKTAVEYCSVNPKPYSSPGLLAFLQSELFNNGSEFSFGPFVYNASIGLPEWISCKTNSGADTIKIWLCDEAFCNQYDESEITVVPPLTDLDTFFGSFSAVSQTISAITVPLMMERIQDAKQEKPETFIRSFNFDYVNASDTSRKTRTTWTVLINGINGDNIDSIKDAIASHILANTSRTKAEWEVIFPGIFKRTEFVILPRWDKMSIENLTLISGLYSSIMKPSECLDFAKNYVDFYSDTHIEQSLVIFPFDYKAITLIGFGGPDNQSGKTNLSEVFPDYLPVANTSLDFSRMQNNTQTWVTMLGGLLVAAETATNVSSLPQRVRRVIRDNKLYISSVHNNISYLVAARSSYNL